MPKPMRITNTRKAVAKLAKRSPRKRPMTYRQFRDSFCAAHVADVVRYCNGDKFAAAEVLDISYSSVKEKVRPSFGI